MARSAFTVASRLAPVAAHRIGTDDLDEAVGDLAGQLAEVAVGVVVAEGGEDGAAAGVAEDDDQREAQDADAELDAAEGHAGQRLAGGADGEQVADALVEHDLRGHAGIDAAEQHGDRVLTAEQRLAVRLGEDVRCGRAAGEAPVAGHQRAEGVRCAVSCLLARRVRHGDVLRVGVAALCRSARRTEKLSRPRPAGYLSRQARSNGSRQVCGAMIWWIALGPHEPGA